MTMKRMKPVLAMVGIALTSLWTVGASAGVHLGYVQLDNDGREVRAGGGGVSKFLIGDYVASAQDYSDSNFDASGILGSKGEYLYASCIEYYETWDTSNRWYAIHARLDGAPSATGDITTAEMALIERVITGEFGLDFSSNGPESQDAKVRALQAILWEAGNREAGLIPDVSDDFADGQVDDKGTGGKALADYWLSEYATAGLDRVITYALVTVDWDPTQGKFVDAGSQDFFTYQPDVRDVRDIPRVPVPTPLLLFGAGGLSILVTRHRTRDL